MRNLRVWLVACFAMAFAIPAAGQNIITVAGGGPNNMPAISANLNAPIGAGVDASGNLFIGIRFFKIFRVDNSGNLTLYAGDGYSTADGVPATSADLCMVGMAVDDAGNLFIADGCTLRVRRVDAATRLITTVAGNGTIGYSGDGGLATSAELSDPGALAVDSAGNLFIADGGRIRRVDAASQMITTVAGNGTPGYSGDGGPATSAEVEVSGMCVDSSGNLFFADGGSERVRRVDAVTGVITTVAGNGYRNPNTGYGGFSGDGGPATSAELNGPSSVAVDRAGNLLIADTFNSRIRRVDPDAHQIVTLAGGGTGGDGQPAMSAKLSQPVDVTVDATENLFIVDLSDEKVRKVDGPTQVIATVAGNGSCCVSGDGGPATSADLHFPDGIALDSAGNLFIAGAERVRRVDAATHVINTIAGSDHPQSLGDGGPATSAYLNDAVDVKFDGSGNLFIVDENQFLVRRVDAATQVITTVAGNPNCFECGGFSGDGGPATSAELDYPDGVAVDGAGNLFISDPGNERVRRVDGATQVINTYAGDGYQSYCCGGGFAGDGGPATSAELSGPDGLAVDAAGNLFFADEANQRIRRVDAATGIITTVAGNGYRDPSDPYGYTGGFSGDGGPAMSAELNQPTDVAVDGAGNLFIADYFNNRIRRVDAITGMITTVAGNGTRDFIGDGGAATSAALAGPLSVAVDNKGSLFISDAGNHRIREVVGTATSVNVTSSVNPSVFGQSVTFTATVSPAAGSGTPTGTITFSDGGNTIGSAPLNGGQANLSTSSLAVGPHSILAAYGGDAVYSRSESSALTQSVNPAPTNTSLSSCSNPISSLLTVTFTAVVSVVAPGSGLPGGTVTFFQDGTTALGIVPLNSSGSASFTASALAVAAHPVTAVYNGDGNFSGSASQPNEYPFDSNLCGGSSSGVLPGAFLPAARLN